MIDLDDYKVGGSKSTEIIVIRHIERVPPGIKPDIEGEYHHIKLIGLTLEGARSKSATTIFPSITPSIYTQKKVYSFAKRSPFMQFRGLYKGWLITYKAILGDGKKVDGNVILKWMGCSDINEAIELNWEGTMPLQYGDRNSSLIVPNVVRMRRDLGL